MGGGDLNLKKSWHPSTMKNMEKVWKAEQQDTQEKKRIAELKREIAMERDKEEMKTFAMNQGVIEKKDDKKLDWMYKGPETVNREDYLLGRRIDKQFEKMVETEKDTHQNKSAKNHVDHECIPPSLRFFSGSEQVDLARKLQEDPLYAIKKKEMETRSELLNNPVKLKQLKQLVAQKTKSSKDDKNDKKKKKRKASSDSDGSNDTALDDLIAAKYKKLKGRIDDKDLLKSLKKRKMKKIKKSKRDRSESSSSSSSSEEERRGKSRNSKKEKDERESYDRKNHHQRKSRIDFDEIRHKNRTEKSHDRSSKNGDGKSRITSFGLMRADGSRVSPPRYSSSASKEVKKNTVVKSEQRWIPPKKQKLSEEEKERRRQEMLANASWRDTERKKNLKEHAEKEKNEATTEKAFDRDFIQKHLAHAADRETVASRIKSNINNIQRFKHAMDKNFARR